MPPGDEIREIEKVAILFQKVALLGLSFGDFGQNNIHQNTKRKKKKLETRTQQQLRASAGEIVLIQRFCQRKHVRKNIHPEI